MIRPRWQKVFADLIGNKTRSLLVILSIAVGLFAIGILETNHEIITADMLTGYHNTNPANITMQTSGISDDLLDTVRGMDGVDQAEHLRSFSLRAHTGTSQWLQMDLMAIPDYDDFEINTVSLMEGRFPPKRGEVVLEQSKMDDLNVALGDTLEVELPSGRSRELLVVGVVQVQTLGAVSGGGGFFVANPLGYVNPDDLGWLEQPNTNNRLVITVLGDNEDEIYIQTVAQEIRDDLKADGVTVNSAVIRKRSSHPTAVYVDAISQVLFALGALVVLLSSFLITNTLNALLTQQTQQIGILKLVGGRRWQVALIYLVLILVYGLVALAISIPLSARAAYVLLEYLAGQINVELQGYRVVPAAVYLQIAIAVIVPQLAGLVPVLQGTRIRVQQAFSGIREEDSLQQHGWLEQKLARLRGLPRPLLISLRNTFRRKGRLVLTLITLTLGGAIFIATINTRSSVDAYLTQLSHYFLADVNLSLEDPERIARVTKELSAVPGISLVEGWAGATGEIITASGAVADSAQVIGPPVDTQLMTPTLLEGRWLLPEDARAIVVNERFRDSLPGLQIGDSVTLRINGKETDWVVVGFLKMAGRSLDSMAYTSYDQLAHLTGSVRQARLFRIAADQPNRTLEEQSELARQVELAMRDAGYTVTEARAGLMVLDKTDDGLNVMTSFLLILSGLAAVVGSIGLAGTLSINVLERMREIGVMRAVGASNRDVIRMVLVEGLIIGLLSWLLSLVVAVPISKLLSDLISMAIFSTTSIFVYTLNGPLLWLGVVIVLSVISSLAPAISAARLTIREVLAYE
ncbi:MAG: ABC transporter permease [Anaerolineae bacterium]|nr:ABC transporter permease [Anaerolineae bacterium]